METEHDNLQIGWSAVDLTPDQPALIGGQHYARVSEGVMDPITATVLALASGTAKDGSEQAVLVSCDFAGIPDALRDAVREKVQRQAPDLDPMRIMLNATHTHTAPQVRTQPEALRSSAPPGWGVDLDAMDPQEYATWAAEQIAAAVVEAWQCRAPGSIGFALGHAVVGYNRRISYYNGRTRMYGETDDPEFSHIEGGSNPHLPILATWNAEQQLTGLVVNTACPSQTSEHEFVLSADFWHETREELRRRFGAGLFVLPQCSAAGDQAPGRRKVNVYWQAEEHMRRLSGRTLRDDIALRIADAVAEVLPYAKQTASSSPCFCHRTDAVELPRRQLTEQDVQTASADAAEEKAKYEELLADLEAHPEKRREPRWYVPITRPYRRMKWNEGVEKRFQLQQQQPTVTIEVHVLRLGDIALASNPFEYYLDFGLQIQARSKAIQTFVVQLAGTGTYLPTERAVAGRSYGAVPASTTVGPDGGRKLVDWTTAALNDFWSDSEE